MPSIPTGPITGRAVTTDPCPGGKAPNGAGPGEGWVGGAKKGVAVGHICSRAFVQRANPSLACRFCGSLSFAARKSSCALRPGQPPGIWCCWTPWLSVLLAVCVDVLFTNIKYTREEKNSTSITNYRIRKENAGDTHPPDGRLKGIFFPVDCAPCGGNQFIVTSNKSDLLQQCWRSEFKNSPHRHSIYFCRIFSNISESARCICVRKCVPSKPSLSPPTNSLSQPRLSFLHQHPASPFLIPIWTTEEGRPWPRYFSRAS